jgi:hypothetical protein
MCEIKGRGAKSECRGPTEGGDTEFRTPTQKDWTVNLRQITLLFTLALCLTSSSYAERTTITRQVAPGIAYTQEITTGDAPLIVNVLSVDLKTPGVRVRCGQALDSITEKGATKGREGIPPLARRNGAVAAINADFFPFTGDPLGVAIRDGELLSEPMHHRACIGIGPNGAVMDVLVSLASLKLSDGSEVPLGGINRVPAENEITVLTPTFTATPNLKRAAIVITLKEVNLPVRVSKAMQGVIGTVVPLEAGMSLPACGANSVLLVADGKTGEALAAHCNLGETIQFQFDLTSNGPPPSRGRFPSRAANFRATGFTPVWSEMEQAVSGGPFLLRNGQVAVDGEAEDFSKTAFVEKRHPRTAIGTTAEGKLLLVTVDGRQTGSQGASLPELATLMKRFGAVHAINLDGGGSTTMVVGSGVVNAPSDGRVRPVANGLLVFADPLEDKMEDKAEDTTEYFLQGAANGGAAVATVGQSVAFSIVSAEGKPLDPKTPVFWGTADGLGFINQRGIFTSSRAGKSKIVARVGSRVLETALEIKADPTQPMPSKP